MGDHSNRSWPYVESILRACLEGPMVNRLEQQAQKAKYSLKTCPQCGKKCRASVSVCNKCKRRFGEPMKVKDTKVSRSGLDTWATFRTDVQNCLKWLTKDELKAIGGWWEAETLLTHYEVMREWVRSETRRVHRTHTDIKRQKRKQTNACTGVLGELQERQRKVERSSEYQNAMSQLDVLFREKEITPPRR